MIMAEVLDSRIGHLRADLLTLVSRTSILLRQIGNFIEEDHVAIYDGLGTIFVLPHSYSQDHRYSEFRYLNKHSQLNTRQPISQDYIRFKAAISNYWAGAKALKLIQTIGHL
jgi:hypothetical protein